MRTWKPPGGSCRWRFWQAHGAATERFAGEVAEHLCSGEYVWIAGDTPDGTTWMIDRDPVTLLEVIDRLPGSLYGWVIDQTLASVGGRLRPIEGRAELETATHGDDDAVLVDGKELAGVRELVVELLRLVHASDVVAARLGLDGPMSGRGGQTALERVWSSAAA